MRPHIAAVAALAFPALVVAAEPLHRGINLTLWSPTVNLVDLASTLDRAKAAGVNDVSVTLFWFQDTDASTVIAPGGWNGYDNTPTDATVRTVIDAVHARGMNSGIKPIVVPLSPGSWQGTIVGGDEWFDNPSGFRNFITHYADIAAEKGSRMLVIGTELARTTDETANWRNLITDVRSRFSGSLVYGANFSPASNGAGGIGESIAWMDALDYIGIDAYYPLTSTNSPSLGQLRAKWSAISNNITAWQASLPADQQKPVLFTEIGYQSRDGTNRAPWDYNTTTSVDQQEQADCYQAALSTTLGRSIVGTYWWNFNVSPDLSAGNTDYPPQGKIAEHVMSAFYRGGPSPDTGHGARAGLATLHSDSFTRPDSSTLGAGWTTGHSAGGSADIRLANGRVELTITDVNAGQWPSAWATLDLTNPTVAGRGLEPGEYLQLNLQRLTGTGAIGLFLFGQPLASGIGATNSDLRTWNTDHWTDITGRSFNWALAHMLGVRFDSTDGEYAKLSFYLDDIFVGDWMYQTADTSLTRFSLYGQDATIGTSFAFDNVQIYAIIPEPTLIAPASLLILLLRRRSPRSK